MGVPGTYRVTGRGSRQPPASYMGLMGQELDRPAPKGAGAPPIGRIGGEGKEGKGEGKGRIRPPPFLPLLHLFPSPSDGYGGGKADLEEAPK